MITSALCAGASNGTLGYEALTSFRTRARNFPASGVERLLKTERNIKTAAVRIGIVRMNARRFMVRNGLTYKSQRRDSAAQGVPVGGKVTVVCNTGCDAQSCVRFSA